MQVVCKHLLESGMIVSTATNIIKISYDDTVRELYFWTLAGVEGGYETTARKQLFVVATDHPVPNNYVYLDTFFIRHPTDILERNRPDPDIAVYHVFERWL